MVRTTRTRRSSSARGTRSLTWVARTTGWCVPRDCGSPDLRGPAALGFGGVLLVVRLRVVLELGVRLLLTQAVLVEDLVISVVGMTVGRLVRRRGKGLCGHRYLSVHVPEPTLPRGRSGRSGSRSDQQSRVPGRRDDRGQADWIASDGHYRGATRG